MKLRRILTISLVILIASASASAVFAQDAAAVYKKSCAPCHGQDGSGNTPMGKKSGARALGSPEVQQQTDAALQKVISVGKGKMPSFATRLTSTEVVEIVKLIRAFAKK